MTKMNPSLFAPVSLMMLTTRVLVNPTLAMQGGNLVS